MLPVTAEKTLTAARATETYSTNAYPARYSNYPGLTDKCDATLQECTTTGHVGISRAVAPRKGAAEKTPATPFPREEMAWTAMAAIHIVARILRTNVDHLNPARRLAEPGLLNRHAGALPQKSTHQLRSCSWPEVHTISKVQKACFPWGLALMIASVPA